MPRYLIGRFVDPILGLGTGVMAYFLWEYDGKNYDQRPDGRKLADLVSRKWNNQRPSRDLLHSDAPNVDGQDRHRLV
ncbi:unnamed protein product [Sympodiomycopsis kandeliae]